MAPLRAPSGPLLNAQTGRADQDSIESMTTEHRDLNQLVALNPIAIATFRRYLDGGCAPHVIRPCCHRSSSTRATPGADGLQQLLAYNRPLFLQPAVLHQLRILKCHDFRYAHDNHALGHDHRFREFCALYFMPTVQLLQVLSMTRASRGNVMAYCGYRWKAALE